MIRGTDEADGDPSASEVIEARPLGYQPGLDGLRALALLAIFVVHADIGLASGGFLAVSMFFTLSGFLIMSLVIGEHATTERVDLRAFWIRRARRLLPASLVAIASIVVVTVAIGTSGQLRRIQGDALGTLTYMANWRFILVGDEYGARFESESPLLHFWSLAIEEQFYVIFPIVIAIGFALSRKWRGAVGGVLVGMLVLSLAAGVLLSFRSSIDRLYFGTDVRAAELVIGALAAWWWIPRQRRLGERFRKYLAVLGPVLLVLMAALIATARSTDLFWYRGGLAVYATVTCTVLIASIQPDSLLKRALSWGPLVWIGVTSYGAYLVHWPIYVWLRSNESIGGATRLVVGAVAAIGIASVSYIVLERPFRISRRVPRWVLVGAPAALVLVALTTSVVVPPSSAQANDVALEDRSAQLSDQLAKNSITGRPTLAIFGDSTAMSLAIGFSVWDDDQTAQMTLVEGWTGLGCTVMAPIQMISEGEEISTAADCDNYLDGWRESIRKNRPHVALLEVGGWEVCDMKLPGASEFTSLGDPAHDEAVKKRLSEAVDVLQEGVEIVVLVSSPHINRGGASNYSENQPARMDRFNEIVREIAAERPRLLYVDLATYVDALPNEARPDGVHLDWHAATDVAYWMGPQIAERSGIPVKR